jgi:hypothetical protein
MLDIIFDKVFDKYDSTDPSITLNRSFKGMIIEWYLHNIGYWMTLPFIKNEKIKTINERFKHLDLEAHGGKKK